MLTTAATARNIRLIVETIIMSHTGIPYHVEHKAGCTRHAPCAFFGRMRLISWRHVLFWCVWYGLRSSKSESEQWVWCVNIETGSYSNADHTRRIRKGRDVTKSNACAQKTHRTHAVSIQFNAQGRQPHHGFSLLMSVRVQSIIPEYFVLGKTSEGPSQIQWLLVDQPQKYLRHYKIPDFFAGK